MRMTWFFVAVVVITVIVTLARHVTPGQRVQVAHAYARKVNLHLAPGTEAAIGRRLAWRSCTGAVGGLVLSLVPLLVLVPEPSEEAAFPRWLLAVAGYFLGTALGSAGVAWYESTRPLPPGPRLARATSPGLGDYVIPLERHGAWVFAVVAALVALGLVVVDGTGIVDLGVLPGSLVAVTAVVPALAVAAYEAAARWLLARRQVASTTLELAWEDAMRARTLRDSLTVAIMAGVYAPFALLGVVGDRLEGGWPANPGVGLVNGVFLVLLGAVVVVAILAVASRPERHFRTRLWPVAPAPDIPARAVEGGDR